MQIGTTGEYKFVPANIALDLRYRIWIWVQADGDTTSTGTWWNSFDDIGISDRDYYLYVGCPSSVGSMTDSSSLTTTFSSNTVKDVGSDTYPMTFTLPDTTPSYCGAATNSIYNVRYRSSSSYYYHSSVVSDIYFDSSCT